MTLYDYIASLTTGGAPVIWNYKPLTAYQLTATKGKPYIRVVEMPESVRDTLYGNVVVVEQLVEVHILQGPTDEGQAPDRDAAVALYYDVLKAPASVDEGIYNQPLIKMFQSMALMPNYDDNTGGLFGLVRFRLQFARSAG